MHIFFRKPWFSQLAVVGLLAGLLCSDMIAQQPVGPATSEVVQKKIGIRLNDWKKLHLHDEKVANETIATMKRIGCEVTKSQHGDHIDIQYRCVGWKSIDLQNDQQATQWYTWLKNHSLEIVVLNPAAELNLATVDFQMTSSRSAHLHDPAKAQSFIEMLKMLGCQVETNDHNGHIDAVYSCPNWTTIGLPTDQIAHNWQAWLNNNGFQTRHTHKH